MLILGLKGLNSTLTVTVHSLLRKKIKKCHKGSSRHPLYGQRSAFKIDAKF